jgi:hypothetical protein
MAVRGLTVGDQGTHGERLRDWVRGGDGMVGVPKGLFAATLSLLLLGTGLAVSAPAHAQGLTAGAHVYELNENARFRFQPALASEASTSQMMGFVDPGTPLCPAQFAAPIPVLPGTPAKCVINVTGTDKVSLITGLGPITGRFTVVTADLTNPAQVDSPETVVMKGRFNGRIDFSPALQGLPYGTITGKLTVDGAGDVPFFGVFLLPFEMSGVDLYLSYTLVAPVTSGVQLTGVVAVQPFERALLYPTARFDIFFQ